MAISYTDNFEFPLLESGSNRWDAVINGALESLDLHLWQNRNQVFNLAGNLIVGINGDVVLRERPVQ
jgi:hypothetical protein